MGIKGLEFEGLTLRAKVAIPFVEEDYYLPSRVFVDGYFPAGTLFKFYKPVCSHKMNSYGQEVNDYCHAVSLMYSNKLNGAPDSEEEKKIYFHVDLSALFLLTEPLNEAGEVIEL